jgi:hypothetical protein
MFVILTLNLNNIDSIFTYIYENYVSVYQFHICRHQMKVSYEFFTLLF